MTPELYKEVKIKEIKRKTNNSSNQEQLVEMNTYLIEQLKQTLLI